MKIDPGDLYHQEVYSILKELKHEYDISGSRQFHYSIRLVPFTRPGEIPSITKQRIFRNLKENKIIRELNTYPSYIGKEERPDATFHNIELELQEPAFTNYLEAYKKAFNLPRQNKLTIQKGGISTLSINGEQFKATFRRGSDSLKVLMLLAKNKGEIVSFSDIGEVLKERNEKDSSDERRARDAVQYIKKTFGYNGVDFIKTDYGFCLVCDVEIKS